MTAMVPGRPELAAQERAGLEQARERAEKRIDGLRRSAAEVEAHLRGAGSPEVDRVAVRELTRRHGEILGRLADAIAQRDALERYLERLGRVEGGASRRPPSS